jgi:hypothetical protein
MGVTFDRVLDAFDCPCDKHVDDLKPAPGKVTTAANTAGYVLTHQENDAFLATNRLLAANEEVYWLSTPTTVNGRTWPAGASFISAKPTTLATLQKLASEIGLNVEAVSSRPSGNALKLAPVRIGLVDKYGGSAPSGWIRQQLERFEFRYELLFPQTIDRGNLSASYDVLLVPDDALQGGEAPRNVPAEYQNRVGTVSETRTIPAIQKFIEDGGSSQSAERRASRTR